MNSRFPSSESSQRRIADPVRRTFVSAHRSIGATWVLGTLLALAVLAVGRPEWLLPVAVLSLASGLIAHASLLPGTLLAIFPVAFLGPRFDRAALGQAVVPATMLGAVIRLFGTVALIVACRYHLPEFEMVVVAVGLLWYALLTTIETYRLSRGLPAFDREAAFDSSSTLDREIGRGEKAKTPT